MSYGIDEYGILVSVKAATYDYLFLDDIDRQRYILILLKMLKRNPENEAAPVVAGMTTDNIRIYFSYGYEEELRYIFRMVHAAYASYRKVKKCPIKFGKSKFELLDETRQIVNTIKDIRDNSDYVCTVFDEQDGCYPPPGTILKRIPYDVGKISEDKLLELACRFQKVSSVEEFLNHGTKQQKSEFTHELREKYDLSNKDIGNILKRSGW